MFENKTFEQRKEIFFLSMDTKKKLEKALEGISEIEEMAVWNDEETYKSLQEQRLLMNTAIEKLKELIAGVRVTFSYDELVTLRSEYKKRALAAL